MEKFLIKLLSVLGLGINGVIMSPEHFTSRLIGIVGDEFRIERLECDDEHIVYRVNNEFNLIYIINKRRIVDIKVN